MRMYEQLVKALHEHAKPDGWDCSVCMCRDAQNRGFFTCTEELAALAADAIEKLCSFVGAEDAERMEAYPPKEESVMNKPTNADRIRAMSDEELAELLSEDCPPNYMYCDGCISCWLDWLKQEG